MQVLITAATLLEIQPTMQRARTDPAFLPTGEVSFLISGVGMVATTYSLASRIFRQKPVLILQAGIGGCFSDHPLTTTFAVNQDSFGDLGVMEGSVFKNIFELGLAHQNDGPFSGGVLINPHEKLLELACLEKAGAVTASEVTTAPFHIKRHKQNGSPTVESMEGAAFHYVCLQEGIPFLQIRSVSNYVGERDKTKWKLTESVRVLNEHLMRILTEIFKHDETYFGV